MRGLSASKPSCAVTSWSSTGRPARAVAASTIESRATNSARDVVAPQERRPGVLAGVLDGLGGRVDLARDDALQPRGVARVERGDLLRPGGGGRHGDSPSR